MNKKIQQNIKIISTALISLSILLLLLVFIHNSANSANGIYLNSNEAETNQTTVLTGIYKGMISINIPVQLGVVDLGLTLEQQGDITLNGQINITDTLVYSSTPAITGILIDNGVLTPTFELTSETFTITVAGREVQRTFQLSGDVLDNGITLQGTYTETLTGLTPEPLVVVGEFILTRPEPLSQPEFPIKFIYLPIINR